MKISINRIKKSIRRVYSILLFVFSAFLIFYFLPQKNNFPYDFDMNSSWKHKDLYAPFSFPIYKTKAELELEKKTLLKNVSPYFLFNEKIKEEQVNKFRNELQIKQGLPASLVECLTKILEDIYIAGIIESAYNSKFNFVGVVKNNISENISISQFYTIESAKTDIKYRLNSCKDIYNFDIDSINFVKYLKPNVIYDKNLNKDERKTILNKLSLTKYLVNKGKIVIRQGENIDSTRFQIITSLKKEYDSRFVADTNKTASKIGLLMIILILMLSILVFIINFRKSILRDLSQITFIPFIIIVFIFSASIILKLPDISLFILPTTIIALVLSLFFDSFLAIFVFFISNLILAFFLPNSYEYILLQSVAGMVAIFSTKNLVRRGQLFYTSIYVFIAYSVVYICILAIKQTDWELSDLNIFIWFAANSFFILLAYPLIYIFEKLFGFISDITLIELSDTNNTLLRTLSNDAPGTFQHTLQVASLAEAAIVKINGNRLLVRAGVMYHDIGKTKNPLYFVENQKNNFNPHSNLEYKESAKIIINHVIDGVKIARKHRLPQKIIDFILTHHGTSKAEYFYRSFLNENPSETISRFDFTYPGPAPYSKETAVVMMADSIEASARTLKVQDDENIRRHVNTIIDGKIKNGQLDYVDITIKEINIVKEVFIERLKNMYHTRVQYPESKD